MSENSDNIMIALLPTTTDWSTLDLPHLTLVFSGKVEEHSPIDFNSMAKDAGSIAMLASPVVLNVKGVGPMGPPDDLVSAIMFQPTSELVAMRTFVEKWNRSEYPEFIPHATIGPYSNSQGPIPAQIVFDKISVCWGNDKVTFRLRY